MTRRGPLADSYAGAVALVVFSLVPFLVLTAGVFPLVDQIARSLSLSTGTIDLAIALSTGGYAVGTVLAVQFAVRLPARRMLVVYEAMFVVASVLAAWAPAGSVFIAAFIVQGLCTSLMLIAAVPPLVTGWPVSKMPVTGMIMNLCIFGAVAIGPTLGSFQAAASSWRTLFWGVAGLAVLAFLFSLLTFEDEPAHNREAPWDLVAMVLAVGGCGAAFFGAGDLEAAGSISALALVTLLAGSLMIVLLVTYEYRLRRPLMPVRELATTVPVTGILIALVASAASFGVMELVFEALDKTSSPTRVALLFLPEFVAAVAIAAVFGALFRTRFTPLLAFSGLATIVGAAALLLGVVTTGGVLVAVGTGLVGLGVGASVSPALFITGFSLRSSLLQPVFAMIELLRGVTAFLVAPLLVFIAGAIGTGQGGLEASLWICLAIAGGGGLCCGALFLAGKGRLQKPDLDRWQNAGQPAWESPPLLARLRRKQGEPVGARTARREPVGAGTGRREPGS